MPILGSSDQSVQVVVASKSDTKGIEETNKALGKLDRTAADTGSGGFSKLSSFASGAIGVLKTATTVMGAATLAAGTFALKSAADFQQTRIGLENMLGSAEKAKTLLSDISKFAAETPFEFPELAQATRQLVAFGFSAEDAFSTMKQLGDVSAAVGAPINDLAYLMGTLRTQGRAFTVDIRQFAQRGIPIYEYLAKVLNTNEQAISGMIEAGKIGFPEVQKAFTMMTAEGGKFHATMGKQSKSLTGLFSTLKDNIGQTARELVGMSATGDVIEGSLFAKLSEGTEGLIEKLPAMIDEFKEWLGVIGGIATQVGDYLGPKLSALWKTISVDLWPAVSNLMQAIGPELGVGLVGAVGLAIDMMNALIAVLSPVIDWLAKNEWAVWAVITAFTAWYATMKATAAFNAIYNSITILNAGLAGVVAQTGSVQGALVALNTSLSTFAGFGIFAGLAIASFSKVMQEIDNLNKALDGANNSIAKRDINAYVKTYNQIKEQRGQAAADSFARQQSRATGGPVNAGEAYAVGDNPDGSWNKTTELFVPKQGGTILNAKQTQSLAGGMGKQITINQTNNNYSEFDLNAANKELGWRLASI